jgi:hypothetical protein
MKQMRVVPPEEKYGNRNNKKKIGAAALTSPSASEKEVFHQRHMYQYNLREQSHLRLQSARAKMVK